jgi:hypothetical protein
LPLRFPGVLVAGHGLGQRPLPLHRDGKADGPLFRPCPLVGGLGQRLAGPGGTSERQAQGSASSPDVSSWLPSKTWSQVRQRRANR